MDGNVSSDHAAWDLGFGNIRESRYPGTRDTSSFFSYYMTFVFSDVIAHSDETESRGEDR